jgi:Protein of unknown function (DUF2637)
VNRNAWIAAGVVGSGAAFGLLGAYSSFEAVNETFQPWLAEKAWTVPVGMDLGIVVFGSVDLWQAWRDTRTWWLRWAPHALAVATVWFNVVEPAPIHVKGAHAFLVGLWIIFAAAITHEVKLRVLERKAKAERLDRIRGVRWLLALWSTLAIWHWMVVNEETSYKAARDHRNRRRLARARLKDDHGIWWRWTMSHVERELYRLGPLAEGLEDDEEEADSGSSSPVAMPVTKRNGDLEAAADAIAVELGRKPPRRVLMERLGIGTAKATKLMERYQ